MKQNLFTLCLALCCAMQLFAYDFEVNGIYYNKLKDDTSVEVTQSGSSDTKYSGDIVIPESVTYNGTTYRVTSIGDHAFGYCRNLSSITIGNGINTFGIRIFEDCDNLTSITVAEGNPLYYSKSNCIITKRTKELVIGCKNSIIPSDGSVTSIGDNAFYSSNLRFIEIPNTITKIGKSAFHYCKYLTSITIPNSVTTIDQYAFCYCKDLTSVTIGSGVKLIDDYAFTECNNLEKVVYMGTIQSWCNIAFSSSPDWYNLGNPLMQGADFYINNTKITEVIFDVDPKRCFQGCTSLRKVTFTNSLTTIKTSAFGNCTNLQSIILPNSLTTIEAGAFENCTSLQSIILPNSLTTIGWWAFKNCTSLTQITIPSSISSITGYVFSGCTSLVSATIKRKTPPTIESNTFPITTKIIIPCGSTDAYWADTEWGKYPYYEETFLADWAVKSENEKYGTVSILQSPSTCDNTTAIFKATAADGYSFKKWNDGNIDNPRTVKITKDIEYIATFAANNSAIENVSAENVSHVQKVLENGTIYILCNGEKYTIDGRKVE